MTSTYAIELDGCPEPLVRSGKSRAQAKYSAWLEVGDFYGGSFKQFLRRIVSVRRVAPPRNLYEFARTQYGVDVQVGQPVKVGKRSGEVATPIGGPWIAVHFDDGTLANVHPSEVEAEAGT